MQKTLRSEGNGTIPAFPNWFPYNELLLTGKLSAKTRTWRWSHTGLTLLYTSGSTAREVVEAHGLDPKDMPRGVLVGIGCDPLFANLVGHVDAIEIGTAETATLYDFEPLYGPPLIRQQCQNGGWSQFTNPVFRNQGECILAVQKP